MTAASRTLTAYWIVFFGSVWGFAEATLGHLLHLLPLPGVAGDLMFPIACLCMAAAWRRTGRLLVIPVVGMIAMLIKSADLLFPGTTPAMIINPMLAILAESLVFFAGCCWLKIFPERISVGSALILGTTWRFGYFLIAALSAGFFAVPNLIMQGPGVHFSFILLHGLVGAIVLLLAFHINSRIACRLDAFHMRALPVSLLLIFFLALASEIIF